ncbi:MBL fold metallo-hydrolase, partial [Sphingobium yanoikuyae]|nr:MBL fold metallo-hydrolase [Sphingobium yanoikuyae]MDH2135491.1 MBL fold metallo-hydrolase [Sphingobium yanoikuyae]MDH2170843.1 MBL fold metallo-hydrolase [Sphingobium yanoikuyae]MDH2170845.1 MBL fold metallo-hydrolase [Sphingobium yanoikuyae]
MCKYEFMRFSVTDSALAAASSQISAAQVGIPQIKAFFDEPTFTVT